MGSNKAIYRPHHRGNRGAVESINGIDMGNDVFGLLSQIADVDNLSNDLRREYEASVKRYNEMNAFVEEQREIGKSNGISEGVEKGLLDTFAQYAEGMKSAGISIDDIQSIAKIKSKIQQNKEAETATTDSEEEQRRKEILSYMPWVKEGELYYYFAGLKGPGALSDEERRVYSTAIRHFRDTLGVMQGARGEGFDEGFEKGLEAGRHAAQMLCVKELKDMGVSIDVIQKITGFTAEEIEAL